MGHNNLASLEKAIRLWFKNDAFNFLITILGAILIFLVAKIVIGILKRVLSRIYS